MKGFLICVALSVSCATACETFLKPDCSKEIIGSFHLHDKYCSSFYRCDEFGQAVAFSCPQGQYFLGRSGELCVEESRVPCDRCEPPKSRCGDCGCSTTYGPTTERVSSLRPTTERVTPAQPTTERVTPAQPTTERPGAARR